MVDVAELGLSVRSDGVVVASDRLDRLEKKAGRAEKASERLAKRMDRLSNTAGRMGRNLTIGVTAPMAAASAASIKLAIDAEETANKFNVVFRGSIQESRAELERLTKTIPLTRTQMEAMAAGIQDMLVPMGVARGEAAGMSVDMIQLAGDMASFNNVGTDRVLMAMQSALAGSSEPMRRFGVDTRETRLEQLALEEGIIGVNEELDNSSRAQAVLMAITEDSTDAMGDAARTVDSAANQLRFLQRDVRQLSEDLGKELIPIFRDGLEAVREWVTWFKNLDTEQQKQIAQYAAMTAALGPLLLVFSGLLKVLANLVRIGPAVATAIRAMMGPIGLLTVAVGGIAAVIVKSNNRFEEMASISDETAEAVNQAMRSFSDGAENAAEKMESALSRIRREMEKTKNELQELQGEVERRNNQVLAGSQLLGGAPPIQQERGASAAEEKMERLRESARETRAALAVLEGTDIFTQIEGGLASAANALGLIPEKAEKSASSTSEVSKELEKAAEKGKDLAESLTQELAMWGMSEAESIRYEASLAALNNTYGDATDQVVALMEAKADLVDADRDAEESARDQEEAQAELNKRLQEQQQLYDRLFPKQAKMRQFANQIGTILDRELGGDDAQFGGSGMFGGVIEDLTRNADQFQNVFEAIQAAWDDLDSSNIERELENLRRGLDSSYDESRRFQEGMETLQEALDAKEITQEQFDDIAKALEQATVGTIRWANELENATDQIAAGISSMRSMFDEGSEGYQRMTQLLGVMNVAQGIAAVLNQLSKGDPWSAFARAAAAASQVMALGVDIGSMSSNVGIAQRRQETQGTGSVLGMADEKSESISNALEITADATTKLVGINRGMRNALENLSEALTGATTQLARGFGRIDFGEIGTGGILDDLNFADPFGGAGDIFGLFSGEANLVDEGIEILGGTMNELINDVLVGAFQDVEERGWILDDFDMSTSFEELGEDAARQFQLIFASIADTVQEGAEALGLSADDVSQAIAEFEVERQRISLMDLDADEQREELEAVFSRIFDDLAAEVVPFIDQFQQVGEGLGETLIRVATSVQVMEEAIDRLGFTAERTGAEQFAQMSVELVEMSGGINEFISQMENFIDSFASEEHKLRTARSDMVEAFARMGEELPQSRDAVWELMEAQDANTAEGREAISMLLELTDSMDDFFSGLERFRDDMESITDEAARASGEFDPLQNTIDGINDRVEELIARGEALGVSEQELADIRAAGSVLIQDAIDDWQEQQDDFLQGINDSLAEFTMSDFQRDIRDIGRSFREAMEEGRRLGLSTEELANVQALAQARQQRAVQQLESTIRDFVGQLYGTTLEQLDEQIADVREQFDGTSEMGRIVEQIHLEPLLEERERLQEQQRAAERLEAAQGLAQGIADLAGIRGVDDFAGLADEFGFALGDLAGDLGIDESRLVEHLDKLREESLTITSLDDMLSPHVDRLIEAILEGGDMTKPVVTEGGGKSAVSTGQVVVNTDNTEMLAALRETRDELREILQETKRSVRIDEKGYETVSTGLRDIGRTLNTADKSGRRGRKSA